MILFSDCEAKDNSITAPNHLYSNREQFNLRQNFSDKQTLHSIKHFRQAKKILKKIYKDRQIDFYCGCSYNYIRFKNYSRTLLANDCMVTPRKNPTRASRIEWEHIVPAHAFGHNLPCWREEICERKGKKFKGRKCCIRIDEKFSQMSADLHNLRPVPGEINGDRSNFHFGIIEKKINQYGGCQFKVDFKNRLAEPPQKIRGDIARTYFYMEYRYGIKISRKKKRLYEIWNRRDPPDEWEIERNQRIQAIQGNDNLFITQWNEMIDADKNFSEIENTDKIRNDSQNQKDGKNKNELDSINEIDNQQTEENQTKRKK